MQQNKLQFLYQESSESIIRKLNTILEDFSLSIKDRGKFGDIEQKKITKNDFILNIYADSIQSKGRAPLEVLKEFSDQYLQNIIFLL